MITSTSNPQVKNLVQLQNKAKARREQGRYVVEGVRMCAEAPEGMTEAVYVSASFLARPESEALLAGKRYEVLSDAVFARVSDTRTPQGILCVMRMPDYTWDEILTGSWERKSARRGSSAGANESPAGRTGLWLALESLQDPGNLGTVFRTAEGVGAAGLVLDDATADVFNPKTVRAAMGSLYRVPFVGTDDLPAMLERMKARGIRVFAADLRGSVDYAACDYTGDTAFLIGNEGNGLSEAALSAADARVRIPMRGNLESLNAAAAAAVLLYEADRQRRRKEI